MAKRAGWDWPELERVELRGDLRYLLEWYEDLASGRQSGMTTSPISWVDLKAWSELTDRTPNAWEIRTLREIDKEVLRG